MKQHDLSQVSKLDLKEASSTPTAQDMAEERAINCAEMKYV